MRAVNSILLKKGLHEPSAHGIGGSRYDGMTQWKLARTQQDACAVGCYK